MAKILVIKPQPGRFKALFSKLTNINSKNGPFDLILCVSDLFKVPETPEESEELDDLMSAKVWVPVRTFCMIGSIKLPKQVQDLIDTKDGLICPNLELLAPNSTLTLSTVANLRIANFSGIYDPTRYNSSFEELENEYICAGQLSSFLTKLKSTKSSPGIDILLTHSLPQLLTVNCAILPKDYNAPAWGCPPITEVIKACQPRYHFSGGAVTEFWEREPWLWDPPPLSIGATNDFLAVTRFVNLGHFGNEAKERWFYAFNIQPISATKPIKPANATLSPYSLMMPLNQKRGFPAFSENELDGGPNFRFGEMEPSKKKARNGPPANYICKICQTSGHWIQECPEKVEKPRQPKEGYVCRICNTPGHLIQDCPMSSQHNGAVKVREAFQPKEIGPDSCWFCLSNPQVSKHLIASIGTETYLTLPKGQLPDTNNNCPVPGGGHVLLIPIAHYPSLLALPSELAIPIVVEIEQYKSALKRCYEAYSASMVSFEVAKLSGRGARAGHAHLQICPVPNSLADQVENAFVEEGNKQGISFVDEEALKQMKDEMKEAISYFKVGLPNGKALVHLMKPDGKFNLQFGRIALSNVLGTPDRINWKTCEKSENEEKQDCRAFQKAFAAYEPKF